jgi:hypothetical protein
MPRKVYPVKLGSSEKAGLNQWGNNSSYMFLAG